eukprot:305751_1
MERKSKTETGFHIYHTSYVDFCSMDSTLCATKVWIDNKNYDSFAISTSKSLRMINSKLNKTLIKQLQPLIDQPLYSNNRKYMTLLIHFSILRLVHIISTAKILQETISLTF